MLIKGTRVMVATIVGHVGAGDSVADVSKEYRVSADDVLAAIAYAAEGCLFIIDERRARVRRPSPVE